MIAAVSSVLDIPVMVGGGIRTGEQARQAAEAGASIVVVGTALEQDPSILSELVQGAHLA
jgi:heptaprenylglyceryl phosphate synthase